VNLLNAQWWYALSAWLKDKAETVIGTCLFIANTLDPNVANDDDMPPAPEPSAAFRALRERVGRRLK
jgi:hypothetical protein